jgi:hypothetical protein
MDFITVTDNAIDSFDEIKSNFRSCKSGKSVHMKVHYVGDNSELTKRRILLEKLKKRVESKKNNSETIEEEVRDFSSTN